MIVRVWFREPSSECLIAGIGHALIGYFFVFFVSLLSWPFRHYSVRCALCVLYRIRSVVSRFFCNTAVPVQCLWERTSSCCIMCRDILRSWAVLVVRFVFVFTCIYLGFNGWMLPTGAWKVTLICWVWRSPCVLSQWQISTRWQLHIWREASLLFICVLCLIEILCFSPSVFTLRSRRRIRGLFRYWMRRGWDCIYGIGCIMFSDCPSLCACVRSCVRLDKGTIWLACRRLLVLVCF